MKQLRIVYSYGVDDSGRPILRRQTLNVLDSATQEQLTSLVEKIAVVVQPTIDSAFEITYDQIY